MISPAVESGRGLRFSIDVAEAGHTNWASAPRDIFAAKNKDSIEMNKIIELLITIPLAIVTE